MSDLLLGIDGGGSKTQLCIAHRDGTIVHMAQLGGSNPHDNPAWRDVFLAIRGDIDPHLADIRSAAFAVGSFRESTTIDVEVERFLRETFPLPVLDIENDVYVARDAAFPGRPGLLLIAGTGSMLVGRRLDGTTFRIGGWGTSFGDEGSAYWIGREALSLASRMLDGRIPRTVFADALLATLVDEPSPTSDMLFEWLSRLTHHRSQIAQLSRTVDELARAGHREAAALLDRAADLLVEHLEAGRRLAGPESSGSWSLLGGLGRSGAIRSRLTSRLGAMVEPAMPPCGGAVWRAANNLGGTVDQSWIARLSDGFGRYQPHFA